MHWRKLWSHPQSTSRCPVRFPASRPFITPWYFMIIPPDSLSGANTDNRSDQDEAWQKSHKLNLTRITPFQLLYNAQELVHILTYFLGTSVANSSKKISQRADNKITTLTIVYCTLIYCRQQRKSRAIHNLDHGTPPWLTVHMPHNKRNLHVWESLHTCGDFLLNSGNVLYWPGNNDGGALTLTVRRQEVGDRARTHALRGIQHASRCPLQYNYPYPVNVPAAGTCLCNVLALVCAHWKYSNDAKKVD